MLSVKDEEGTKVEAFDAGADDYVTKPFGIDDLPARSLRHAGKVLTPRALLAAVWGGDYIEQNTCTSLSAIYAKKSNPILRS